MIRVNHDNIEFNGTIAAEFRQAFPDHRRDEMRGLIESAIETDYLFNEGDLICKSYYETLEKELVSYQENAHTTKCALEDLLRDLDHILESCGKNINKKFDNFTANLNTAIGDIIS